MIGDHDLFSGEMDVNSLIDIDHNLLPFLGGIENFEEFDFLTDSDPSSTALTPASSPPSVSSTPSPSFSFLSSFESILPSSFSLNTNSTNQPTKSNSSQNQSGNHVNQNQPTNLKGKNGNNNEKEEEKQMKKQRRLIKNRESAQLSRLRKKLYIDEMESKINSLMNDHEIVVKQLQNITSERNKLQQEVLYLRNLLKNNPPSSSSSSSSASSTPSSAVMNTMNQRTILTSRRNLNPRNLKKATICMMIMFFSFALLFQSESLRNDPNRNFLTSRALQSLEEQSMIGSLSSLKGEQGISNEKASSVLKERKELNEKANINISVSPSVLPSTNEKGVKSSRKHSSIQSSNDKKEKSRKKIKTSKELESKSLPSFIDSNLSARNSSELSHSPSLSVNSNLITSSVQIPIEREEARETGHVALLIPVSMLSNPQSSFNPSLFDVSCQVLSYYTWPMASSPSASTSSL